jgi:F-type H+-transporting ATPase subunit epsilon
MPLQVELVAAERVVWSGEATFVVARTADGELGALPGHTPVMSVINPSVVEITTADGDKVKAAVEDGFLSIANDRVSILSEEAVLAEEIDVEAAKAEREAATPDSLAWQFADAKVRAAE